MKHNKLWLVEKFFSSLQFFDFRRKNLVFSKKKSSIKIWARFFVLVISKDEGMPQLPSPKYVTVSLKL